MATTPCKEDSFSEIHCSCFGTPNATNTSLAPEVLISLIIRCSSASSKNPSWMPAILIVPYIACKLETACCATPGAAPKQYMGI